MASLALGLVGGFFGGPVGFLIGSMLGNLLFPQKVDGPRLKDLHLHTSSYGGMTPILYGTMRLAGNIDWQTDLTEHSSDDSGKGGPEVVSYTYSASFGVTLCEGPIKGILKIWANGRKIYDPVAGIGSDLPITVYLGGEDQLPDPTMEAHLGTGNVPAYRGLARVVFTDWLLTDYSNTIPNLNFEVYTETEGTIPWQVSTVSGGVPTVHGATYDPSTGNVTVGNYSGSFYVESVYSLLTGEQIGVTTDFACEQITDATGQFDPSAITNPTEGAQTAALGHNGEGVQKRWYHKAVGGPYPDSGPIDDQGLNINVKGLYQNGAIYSIDNVTSAFSFALQKWAADDTGQVVSGLPDVSTAIPTINSSNYWFGSSDTGDVYLYYQGEIGSSPVIQKFDGDDLTLLHTWTGDDLPGGWSITGGPFVVYRGMIAVTQGNSFNSQAIVVYDLATLNASSAPIGSLVIGGTAAFGISRLQGGYCIVSNGFVSLDLSPGAVSLADIVADLSARAGLESSQYDTSGLPDTVRGYLVTQQQDVRSDIDPLRQAYFFDAVEVDDKVVFVKRGGESLVTIPDDDLAAYAEGDTPPPVLSTDRAPGVDLPTLISVNFVNAEADYETGTQQAQRQTTGSQSTVTIDLPISLTNDETKAIAEKHLASTWLERDTHSILVPRKYAAYVPTDVITAHGRTIHIRDKSEAVSGVIKLDGVPALGRIFVQAPKSAGGSGFTPATPGSGSSPSASTTTAVLLDMPLADDGDNPNAFYVGMSGPTGWPGAGLFESSDNGASYSQVFSETSGQVIGTTSTALPAYAGGNTFDLINTVTVVTNGELASATETAVLNGANLCAIGSEFVQFKNATLTATNTYALNGLLRGRRGTEWAMSHHIGETFMLFPAGRVASTELNLARQFKPVTIGATVASATAQSFVNAGAALKPYAPVLLGGGTDASGNVAMNWVRRTRIGGAWKPFVDVPLSEASEAYVVQIWNSDYTQCARVITGITSPTVTYTSAQQVTDFGANQQTIYFTVGQMGSIGLGYQARGTAGGLGVADGDPLSPVSPYQSATSGSPAPPSVPQLTLSMGWANVRKLSSSVGTFNCSNVLVASFTTPASTADGAIGWISAVEFVDPAVTRVATLSTAAGDFSSTALSRVVSKDPTCFFSVGTNPDGYPALSASTTYYFNVKNDDGNGACTCLSSSCGVAVELTKPHGL